MCPPKLPNRVLYPRLGGVLCALIILAAPRHVARPRPEFCILTPSNNSRLQTVPNELRPCERSSLYQHGPRPRLGSSSRMRVRVLQHSRRRGPDHDIPHQRPRSTGSNRDCDAAPTGTNGWTDPGIDEIIANSDLTAAAKLVAVTLIRQWAWFKSSCFPSDQTIASKIGMSPGHVQRCLCELEMAGYIRRERTPRCRIIWLLWRLGDLQPESSGDHSRPVSQSPTRPVDPSPTIPRSPFRAGAQSPIRAGAQSSPAPARNEPVVSKLG